MDINDLLKSGGIIETSRIDEEELGLTSADDLRKDLAGIGCVGYAVQFIGKNLVHGKIVQNFSKCASREKKGDKKVQKVQNELRAFKLLNFLNLF